MHLGQARVRTLGGTFPTLEGDIDDLLCQLLDLGHLIGLGSRAARACSSEGLR